MTTSIQSVPKNTSLTTAPSATARQRRQLQTAGFLNPGGDVLAATRAFQKSWKLPETGVIDSRTAARLQQVETRINSHRRRHEFFASIGQRSAGVRVDEQRLAALGYNVGKIDGIYDRQTAAAVQQFRKDQSELKDGAPYLDASAHAQLAKEVAALAHAPEHGRFARTHHQLRLDGLTEAAAKNGLSIGAKGVAVYNLQTHLLRGGYQTKHANGIFDERTMGALKAFQKHVGLPPTGTLNAATWSKLKNTFMFAKNGTSPAQSVGERSSAVKRSELMLKSLGYKLNPKDGYFTAATRNAVKAFQRKHHLPVSGTIDGRTESALTKAVKAARANSAGGLRGRILKIAASQIGIRGEDGGGGRKFSSYFGRGAESYCADFVSWVYTHAGKKMNFSYVPNVLDHLRSSGKWKGRHNPKPGDMVLFDWNGNGVPDHIGLVKSVNRDGSITTIEGNTANPNTGAYGVWQKRRTMGTILGFGTP